MNLLGRSVRPRAARVPNIVVHVPLDRPNVNFNFAALAEEKYGWDALHPVAARLRAINKDESDEDSDSEAPAPDQTERARDIPHGVANREVSPTARQALGPPLRAPLLTSTQASNNNDDNNDTNNDNNGTGNDEAVSNQKKRRKRRRDLEYYDITDPFIDDDELVLAERTAASKDGFFVFQGPLVAEGETVRIEKADGTQKRGGGGRGSRGGKGSRGRGGHVATTRTPRAKAVAAKAADDAEAGETQSTTVKRAATAAAKKDAHPTTPTQEGPTAPVPAVGLASKSVSSLDEPVPDTTNTVTTTTGGVDAMDIDNPDAGLKSVVTPGGAPTRPSDHLNDMTASSSSPVVERGPVASPEGPSSPSKAGTTVKSKSEAKVIRYRQPSRAAMQRHVDKVIEKVAARKTPKTVPATGVVAASPVRIIETAPSSPKVNTDGSAKKLRKPAREKTVEEKAELARRARETRERKKLEKKAQEDAMLARAIANPAIDTSQVDVSGHRAEGLAAAAKVAATATSVPLAGDETLGQTDVSDEMQAIKDEAVPPVLNGGLKAGQNAEAKGESSPARHIMSLDSVLG